MQQSGTTEEHIIPRSIGGELIIKNGTCTDCLKKIQLWESHILAVNYSSAQSYLGIKTKSNQTRSGFKGPKWDKDFKTAKLAHMPKEEHSGFITTINYERPGIEVGRPPESGFGREYQVNLTQIFAGANVPALATFAAGSEVEFAPLLAKIAHAYWVAKEGPHNVQFLLTDLILSQNYELAGFLIGKCEEVLPNDDLHFIRHRSVTIKGEYWARVDFAIFSCFNRPEFQARYSVYVGKIVKGPSILSL